MFNYLLSICSTVATDFQGEGGFPWNRALKYKRPDEAALVGTLGLLTLEACFADNMLGEVKMIGCLFLYELARGDIALRLLPGTAHTSSYAHLLLSTFFAKHQNWGHRVKAFDIGALPFLVTACLLRAQSAGTGTDGDPSPRFPPVPGVVTSGRVNPDPLSLRMNAGDGQAFLLAVFKAATEALPPPVAAIETAPTCTHIVHVPLATTLAEGHATDDDPASPGVSRRDRALQSTLRAGGGGGARCSSDQGGLLGALERLGFDQTELEEQAGRLLASLGLHRFTTVEQRPADPAAPMDLPFDLTGHREADTPLAASFLSQIRDDIRDSNRSGATKVGLTCCPSAALQSLRRSVVSAGDRPSGTGAPGVVAAASSLIKDALVGLGELDGALLEFLQREGVKVQEGVRTLCAAVAGGVPLSPPSSSLPPSSAGGADAATLDFQLQRLSGTLPSVDFQTLVSALINRDTRQRLRLCLPGLPTLQPVLQAVAVCALRTVRLSQASRCLALGATLRHQLLTLGSSLLMRCALDVCTALLDGPTGDESTEAGALQLDAGRVRSLVGAQLVLCPAGEMDDSVLSHRVRLRAEVLQDVVAHVRATDVPLLDAVAHVRATLRCTLAFLVAHGECSSSSGAGGPGAGGPDVL